MSVRDGADGDLAAGRIAAWCGPVSIAIAAVGILGATLLAPWFSWTNNALSDLGAVGASTASLFNGTLVLTGVVGLPFVVRLALSRTDPLRRWGVAIFGASLPFLALVGVFPLPSPYHGPVAIAFFVLFTVGIAVDGVGAVRAGEGGDGAISLGLAAVHVLGWVGWAASGLSGVALPEIVGTAAIGVWVVRRFRELRAVST